MAMIMILSAFELHSVFMALSSFIATAAASTYVDTQQPYTIHLHPREGDPVRVASFVTVRWSVWPLGRKLADLAKAIV